MIFAPFLFFGACSHCFGHAATGQYRHMFGICQYGVETYNNNGGFVMRTVSIFTNCRNQAVRIPREFEFKGISKLEIHKEGDSLILRPVRPSWRSLLDEPKADNDFLKERKAIIDGSRFVEDFA
jgi:antitoxin VapB